MERTGVSWSKPVKNTIYTLNIGNYAPEICALTYPLMEAYARKIGADFYIIRDKKYPEWPVVYEKLRQTTGTHTVDAHNTPKGEDRFHETLL